MDNHENSPDAPRNPGDLEQLRRAVEQLAGRLDSLEERLQQAPPELRAKPAVVKTPESNVASAGSLSQSSAIQAGQPQQAPKMVDRAPDFETQLRSGLVQRALKAIPIKKDGDESAIAVESNRESLPVILMGVAGGFAILAGLLFFTWYSIQQGWISPAIRLSIGATLAVAGMLAAWYMGAGKHRTVAASLGGAGLGVWFGVILVARHVHAYLEPNVALVLLALGSACCYFLASHRNLRFIAILAAVAAFATPLSTGFEARGLNALMGYQVVVIALLYRLESRKRWPELGHIAVASTWYLLFTWAAANTTDSEHWTMLAWAIGLLLQGQLHNWFFVRNTSTQIEPAQSAHLAARTWAHCILSWTAAVWACNGSSYLGRVVLGLAVLNFCSALSIWMLRKRVPANPPMETTAPAHHKWIMSGSISVAWMQLLAFAPIELENQNVFLWWAAMSVIAWALHARSMRVTSAFAIAPPYCSALLWSFAHNGPWAAHGGFMMAAIPLAVGLLPRPDQVQSASGFKDRYLALLMIIGSVLIMLSIEEHMPLYEHRHAWILLVLLLSYGLGALRCAFVTTTARGIASLLMLLSVLALTLFIAIQFYWLWTDLSQASRKFAADRLPAAGIAAGVAIAAQGLMWAWRPSANANGQADPITIALLRDLAGILRPLALLLAAVLCVTEAVPHLTSDPSNARSLNQAGWSLCFAIGSLSLLVRGLLQKRLLWRKAGLLALLITTVKLISVDLVEVSTVWRVLSFIGLGVCLLLGAYAYRRLGHWVGRTDKDPGSEVF